MGESIDGDDGSDDDDVNDGGGDGCDDDGRAVWGIYCTTSPPLTGKPDAQQKCVNAFKATQEMKIISLQKYQFYNTYNQRSRFSAVKCEPNFESTLLPSQSIYWRFNIINIPHVHTWVGPIKIWRTKIAFFLLAAAPCVAFLFLGHLLPSPIIAHTLCSGKESTLVYMSWNASSGLQLYLNWQDFE